MNIDINKTTKIIKKTVINLSTDNLEEILIRELNLTGEIDFNWNIGQWVSLTITTKEESEESELKEKGDE